MPLGSQGKRKAARRAVDMSMTPLDAISTTPAWTPPPLDECEENSYTFAPDGASIDSDRVIVRMNTHLRTDELAEFAVMQQTHENGQWWDVTAGDSCHDVDVHIHRYGRSTGQRVGEPEILMPVACQADLNKGYDEVYRGIAECWEANRERWKHA